jgi:hypothetical protein
MPKGALYRSRRPMVAAQLTRHPIRPIDHTHESIYQTKQSTIRRLKIPKIRFVRTSSYALRNFTIRF